MLTQTEAYLRLEPEIDRLPAIDTHVHLDVSSLLAPSLVDVLTYHNYFAEITAGRPFEFSRDGLSPREQVREIVPALRRSDCSSHAWMLRQILRSAYGFDEELTEGNCDALFDQAEEARARPERVKEVLRLAGVAKILTHLPLKPLAEIGCDESVFAPLSDLDVPRLPSREALTRFEEQTGASVHSASDMREAVFAYLRRAKALGRRGQRVNLRPRDKVLRPGDAAVEAAFDRAATGKALSNNDLDALATFATDSLLMAAAETAMTTQVFIDGRSSRHIRMPSAEPNLFEVLSELAADHPQAALDVYTISAPATQNLCLLAKYAPNLHLGGIWWYCQFPEIMSGTYALRLEMLAASRWSVFFSDAYVVEWIIGKVALTRKVLTQALTAKVLDGYMTEDAALRTARQVLFETPARLYGLE